MLKNPQNPALLQEAQRYTEDFAAIKGIFEGLYIATPDTYVLTHTSQGAIGITTRSGDSLEEFQNTILAEPELTNLGIMKSPGTGSMILSMYYPIFDGRTCIGFVGAGVYASHLTDELLGLNTQAGTYSFQDEAGVRQLVAYKYLADRNWVFMVHDNAAEVYEKVAEVRRRYGCDCSDHSADSVPGRPGAHGHGACHPAAGQPGAFRRPGSETCRETPAIWQEFPFLFPRAVSSYFYKILSYLFERIKQS